MTHIREIAEYLDALLGTAVTPDYPPALNGLQCENQAEIRGIAAAVDFSDRAVDGAIAANAPAFIRPMVSGLSGTAATTVSQRRSMSWRRAVG